jgi:hypothetical protein
MTYIIKLLKEFVAIAIEMEFLLKRARKERAEAGAVFTTLYFLPLSINPECFLPWYPGRVSSNVCREKGWLLSFVYKFGQVACQCF